MIEKYQGIEIIKKEAQALKDLEELIGKPIPRVFYVKGIDYAESEDYGYKKSFDIYNFGFMEENGHVIGLGLCNNYYDKKLSKDQILFEKKLKLLPDSIGNLRKLKELYLFNNELTNLPVSIGGLTALQILDLHSNELSKLPESIGQLQALEVLNLNFNQIKSIPNFFGSMNSLKKLLLRRNKLVTLPTTLTALSSLERLVLTDNKIKSLPKSFGDLTSLTELDLQSNQLQSLPDSISNLVNLIWLIASNNKLISLPSKIGDLKKLENLYLDSNLLVALSNSFDGLKELRIIDLGHNRLSEFPELSKGHNSVQNLNLSHNNLSYLPKSFVELKELKRLNLNNNQFSLFPYHIWRLNKLEELTFDFNKSLEENECKYLDVDLITLLKYFKEKDKIQIFISYEESDFNNYRVDKITKFLKNKEEIEDVIHLKCDISKSQLLFFIATKNSLFKSENCKKELEIANNKQIEIIPIKGQDISWSDLKVVNLSRELGIEFSVEDFKGFCSKLYDYVKRYKRREDFYQPFKKESDQKLLELKKITIDLIDSNIFTDFLSLGIEDIWEIFKCSKVEKDNHSIGGALSILFDSSCKYCLLDIGNRFFEEKDYNKMKKTYNQLIELDPNYSPVWINFGNFYTDQENYSEAERCYKVVLERCPRDANAWGALGSLYYKQKDYSEAERCYIKAIKLEPLLDVYNNLGELYHEQSLCFEAEKLYVKLIKEYPNNDKVKFLLNEFRAQLDLDEWYLLGVAYYNEENYDEAERCFKELLSNSYKKYKEILIPDSELIVALGLAEKFSDVYYYLGNISYYVRQEGKIHLYKKALDYDPNNISALKILGEVYYNQKNYFEAITYLNKIIKINTQDLSAYSYLGVIHYEQKNYTDALSFLKIALMLNPKDSTVISYLKAIYNEMDLYNKKESILNKSEYRILIELERFLGEIIPISIDDGTFGFLENDGYVEHIRLTNKNLKDYPKIIEQFKLLKLLDLNRNQLECLPESIGNPTTLQTLYLSHNQLSTLPESIGELKSLQTLDLHQNKLKSLPESFGLLKKLRFINLSNNLLYTLPESFNQLNNLEELYFGDNHLEQVSEQIEKVFNKLKENGCKIYLHTKKTRSNTYILF